MELLPADRRQVHWLLLVTDGLDAKHKQVTTDVT